MKPTDAPRSGSRRSLLPWLFGLWLLALAIASLWRALTLWNTRSLLVELESKLSPAALTLFVGLSALCGVGLALSSLGLWRRREWGRQAARALLITYFVINQAYVWLFVQSGLLWERRWVNLVLALGTAGFGSGILTWRTSRRWLGLQ